MSIYIPSMEMPKSCSECFADDNGWCNILGCSISDSVALLMIERRRDCPLVEVPPHGALKDADALIRDWPHGFVKTADVIANAPTIIPPDPGKEGAGC